MNKYVKIKLNGKITPYLLYVDENYVWTEEQKISEKGKGREVAKMAFLDHGVPIVPVEALPELESYVPSYLTPTKGIVFLIYEGGNFMVLMDSMEIVEEKQSQFYPIEKDFAIVCENDPWDKWHGGLDYQFKAMYENKYIEAKGFHYMFNFRNRTEAEVIDAFKNTPAILFSSSYSSVDWWELMIRCIIKSKTKAKVIGAKPSFYGGGEALERFNLFVEMAKKFDVEVLIG